MRSVELRRLGIPEREARFIADQINLGDPLKLYESKRKAALNLPFDPSENPYPKGTSIHQVWAFRDAFLILVESALSPVFVLMGGKPASFTR